MKILNYIQLLLLCIVLQGCSTNSQTSNEAIGSINNKKIYFNEVDEPIKQFLYDELDNIYLKRQKSFNAISEKYILNQEASLNKIDENEYLSKYYAECKIKFGKIFYAQAIKDTFFPIVIDGKYQRLSYYTEEGRSSLEKTFQNHFKTILVDSLKRKYKITFNLDPPIKQNIKIDDLTKINVYKATKLNSHTLTVISDFECSSCRKIYPLIDSITRVNKSNLNFDIIYFSESVKLSGIFGYLAFNQGKYLDVQKSLYTDIYSSTDSVYFAKLKNTYGLKTNNLSLGKEIIKKLEINLQELQKRGIVNTPTILIDGNLISNFASSDDILNYIDKIAKE